MIRKIVNFCLVNPYLTIFLTIFLVLLGAWSFKRLPIEAYPDIDDTTVQVITQWTGHAAEEIESQLTIPIETALNGVPHKTRMRSVSLFGLSAVTLTFDEVTNPFTARQYTLEKLADVELPPEAAQELGPMGSATGELYWYFLDAPKRDPMELKTIQDWELDKRFKEVPGLAEVSSMGGLVKQYHVLLNPLAINSYNLDVDDIVNALAENNQNSGGGFLDRGNQTLNIRGVGKADNIADIENIIVAQNKGTPVRIRNIGQVIIGGAPKLGNIAVSIKNPDGTVDDREDVVMGTIVSRKGEVDDNVLAGIHEKTKELNEKFLPKDIKIRPFIDRSSLIRYTTRTVEENLITGMILVVLVLLFFLGNIRGALIVAVTIPLSLMFASIFLDLKNIPANLLSLGALDFGMVVDGAIVMIENIFRHKQVDKESGNQRSMFELITAAAREVERPIVYAIAIIILAYLPIFTLQRIEGRLFSPMAWTVGFALLGSLFMTLTIVPVLASYFLKGDVKEWHNPITIWLEKNYRKSLTWALARRNLMVGLGLGSLALTLILATGFIGSEFLPHLNEGSFFIRATLPPSVNLAESADVTKKARKIFMQYPEIPMTVCHMGRPDDGTDPTGYFNIECFVDLKPQNEWRKEFKDKEDLEASINRELKKIPGVDWGFSQPISDLVEEMAAGAKGSLVVKIYGGDFHKLEDTADEVKKELVQVRGVENVGVFQQLGQPNLNITIDRDKIARYGLNIANVQDVIETAVGGKVATQVIEGEKKFDLVVRYIPQFRDSIDHIKRILVTTPDGFKIPLESLANFKTEDGASMITRERNSRMIAIKFEVRGRDLGSAVTEAQERVKKNVKYPDGYSDVWAGEFESAQRAQARLLVIIPITILGIFFILYLVFDSFKMALIIMANVLFARMGGVVALFLTGTNFSVSSGIGFLAVFGVSVQTGVLLVSYINHLRKQGMSIKEAVIEGSCLRLRPIMMTALVATFGLLPAALSHAIGSDSQRPMAIVIVGGLITDLIMAFFLLPTLYVWFAKPEDKLGDKA